MRSGTGDPSHLAWIQNAARVEADPDGATATELKQAIAYVRYRRGAVIIAARKSRRSPSQTVLDRLDRLVATYTQLLAGRTRETVHA